MRRQRAASSQTRTPPHTPQDLLLSVHMCLHDGGMAAQAEGEEAVRSILPDATIYKLAHMVGTEDRMYNNYAQLAKSLPFVPIFGSGRTKLQPVYVRDVANAIISSLKTKAALGQDYYLAGPEVFT